VKLGESSAYIRSKIQYPEREILLELEINADKANRARINQNPIRSQKELFGLVQSIYFSPEDMDLVRGDPSERRRFLDQLVTLRSPRIAGVITDYERALRQRNSLLKTRAHSSSLEPWDQQVAKFGAEIISARLKLLEEFTSIFINVYQEISAEKPANLTYKSSLLKLSQSPEDNYAEIIQRMDEIRSQELDRGLTLVGPHRDDLLLHLGEHLVKGYASHGESWSIALSLKLASYKLLVNDGFNPILILDDVFSELDEGRRTHLVQLAQEAEQTIITVAVEGDLPPELNGTTYTVKNGSVRLLS
jgi:DNA replication and repair protein RecF